MHAPLMPAASSAHEDLYLPVVAFMAVLCAWNDWDKARQAALVPASDKEKDKAAFASPAGPGAIELK